ncbi:uncharacterized protein LOC132730734 [Ruditapes philippinarum]|uniref:uncharacterized protein LOC132730734 n=1 Tax=Ruditapes philippinarum TaxID=129788 RepID=UPI00295B8596|nr:uncharacterized protein LOC132730734 [Ruditapes philippinarum]
MASGNDSDLDNNFYARWDPYSSGESDFEGFDIDDIPPDVPSRPSFRIDQSINDRENAQDIQFGWSREDSPPTIAPFTGTPGLTVELPDDCTELDFCALLFDDDMWDILVTETNRYAQNRINTSSLRPFSRLRNWTGI